jgi:hypothetical protein
MKRIRAALTGERGFTNREGALAPFFIAVERTTASTRDFFRKSVQ